MAKLNSRLNKLFVKTHRFVSHHDLCILRNYYKAKSNDSNDIETPVNFDDLHKDFLELDKKYHETFDEEIKAEIREKTKANLSILASHIYRDVSIKCEENPNGVWLIKPLANMYQKIIKNERIYLARTK